ncbi:cAMP phosphodiesterase class-II:metallo-beta-lactamase superfamily protein [Azospira sp. I13]|uniref:MBL fold metallo-hydrolase n=1 Tax=Azospira sp. I13 TaxID=1765050 RepID=UPI000D4048A8|nr:3',5'-cyclic-nucleotide phosphodiesterase [Azospira sp. I13]GBG01069.1 cAMP phosphodiesterase class-II:metallo-beta-lactamase superfamily protein [Azospira sp. I13]
MKIRVLGCSGGIGGRHLRTTSILVDHDVLIDAGTGVADLSLAELGAIDHVFITHSHLDHITCLPLLIDTVMDMRGGRPVTVHATDATLSILKTHIFNWSVWPDFSQIPSPEAPSLRFKTLRLGQKIALDGGRSITALPAEHTVPAVGYHLDSGRTSLVFTGDTTVNDAFWPKVNKIANLRYLIIETAFSNRERQLAIASKHLCPSMLAEELAKLARPADIFITHLKPGQIELTMQEIEECVGDFKPRMLQNNQVFEL